MARPTRFTNNYDKTSGQAFRQWTVKRSNHCQDGEWHRQQNVLSVQNSSGKGVTGPRTLVEMIVKVVADNFSFLDADHLDYVPIHLVYRVWEYMEKTQKSLSFQSWKLCTKYIVSDTPAKRGLPLKLFKYALGISQPVEPLVQYMRPLVSTSFDFIVHLTLTGCTSFDTHEVLSLSQLKNLGVLEIIKPAYEAHAATFPRITDSVIREWASQPNPFPILRIMRIWGDDFTTAKSLQYLSKFPALILYDVAGRSSDWRNVDQTLGWELRKEIWSSSLFRTLRRHLEMLGASNVYDEWSGDHKKSVVRSLVDSARNKNLIMARSGRDDQQSNQQHTATGDSQHTTNKTCHDTLFELWGFILYSHIGELLANQDLLALGLGPSDQGFTAHRLTLPPRPFVSLGLGLDSQTPKDNPSKYTDDLECDFEAQSTFFRSKSCLLAVEDRPTPKPKLRANSKRPHSLATPTNGRLKKQKWGDEIFSEIFHDSRKT